VRTIPVLSTSMYETKPDLPALVWLVFIAWLL
jgi:hypothetical protein